MRRGLSRDELAKEAGVPARSFANFLGGSQNLIEEKIGRVALVLGVTYDDLFDVAFEHKFRAGLAMPKPDTPPAPDPEFAEFERMFSQMTDRQREMIVELMQTLAAANANIKKI